MLTLEAILTLKKLTSLLLRLTIEDFRGNYNTLDMPKRTFIITVPISSIGIFR